MRVPWFRPVTWTDTVKVEPYAWGALFPLTLLMTGLDLSKYQG